ncbi:MAG: tRNA ((37)-N6)-dimethylallyltransferase MiaA [Bacteroidetes bacterium]|nr:tRNA ((37)-N6)-dimethylallyltransferase MiaA [Bacteroidota bacterium]
MSNYNCIVVLGPTASGKTSLACDIAYQLNGEIISADSRQVYKGLDIGTGKDLVEYFVNGKKIPYHMIDIREPDEQFFLHEFAELCDKAFHDIRSRNKLPIICGGTGLYLDSLRKDFSFTQVKENPELRAKLSNLPKEELLEQLWKFPKEHTDHTDTNSQKRIIRAIEVATYLGENPGKIISGERPYKPYYLGIAISVDERRNYISGRLLRRIQMDMVRETEFLLEKGITHERLQFLGLEYKYTSLLLQGKLDPTQYYEQLQTAIFQFAKRQMTWFRKMEKEGVKINWIRKDVASDLVIENIKREMDL